jgi:hypothetical protein
MLGNYRVAAQLVASRVALSSTELVKIDSEIVGIFMVHLAITRRRL